MRGPGKSASIIFVSLVVGAALLFAIDDNHRQVAFPGIAALNIALILAVKLWEREKVLPVFDVGMWCVMTSLLYTIIPLVNYIVSDLRFGLLSDSRLIRYQPSPAELGGFHWRHVLYLLSMS